MPLIARPGLPLQTRVQALFLDAHFAVESAARNFGGRFFNFNGSAGVWRRAAIEGLESMGRPHHILYTSANASAVASAVLSGLAVSVFPESGLRPGMRVLSPADGFPELPGCRVGLIRNPLLAVICAGGFVLLNPVLLRMMKITPRPPMIHPESRSTAVWATAPARSGW